MSTHLYILYNTHTHAHTHTLTDHFAHFLPSRTLQVPMMMTTSLGQKFSTISAMSQPGSQLLTTTSPTSAHQTHQKVLIQALPTMVPATGENGQKITVQLAKLITIPASQYAQLSQSKGAGGGFSLMGTPLTLRNITPFSMPTTAVPAPSTTQVLRFVTQQPAIAAPAPAPAPAPTPATTMVVAATDSATHTAAMSECDVTIVKVETQEDTSTQVVTDASAPSDS